MDTVTRRRDRPRAAERLHLAEERFEVADIAWSAAARPIEQRLREELQTASDAVDDLSIHHRQRLDWIAHNPEADRRLDYLQRSLQPDLEIGPEARRTLIPRRRIEPPGPDLGIGLGR